jgi:hypothetical protein
MKKNIPALIDLFRIRYELLKDKSSIKQEEKITWQEFNFYIMRRK